MCHLFTLVSFKRFEDNLLEMKLTCSSLTIRWMKRYRSFSFVFPKYNHDFCCLSVVFPVSRTPFLQTSDNWKKIIAAVFLAIARLSFSTSYDLAGIVLGTISSLLYFLVIVLPDFSSLQSSTMASARTKKHPTFTSGYNRYLSIAGSSLPDLRF